MPRTILGTEAAPRYCVTRAEWGARAPKYTTSFPVANKPTTVGYEHHTVTAFGPGIAVMRQVQNFHMDSRGWSDIAYSFLVDDDGVAYEGRGWYRAGGHTAGQNTVSFAVCHIGDYSSRRASEAALDTAAALWQEGILLGAVSPTFDLRGHRQAPGAFTACPGDALFAQLPDLRSRVGHLPTEDDLTDAQAAQLSTIETICRAMLQGNWAGGDLSWLDVRIGAVLAAVAGISIPGGVVDVEALADALKGTLSAELAADLAARLAA